MICLKNLGMFLMAVRKCAENGVAWVAMSCEMCQEGLNARVDETSATCREALAACLENEKEWSNVMIISQI